MNFTKARFRTPSPPSTLVSPSISPTASSYSHCFSQQGAFCYDYDSPQTTNDERQTTNDKRRTTNDERRTTNDERRTTNDKRQRRTTNDERRTTNDERQRTSERTNTEEEDNVRACVHCPSPTKYKSIVLSICISNIQNPSTDPYIHTFTDDLTTSLECK